MRLIHTVLLIATIAIFGGSNARADDKQEIRDLYAKLRLAILGTLPEGIATLETQDFRAKDLQGKPAEVNHLIWQMKLQKQDVSDSRMDLMIYKFTITPPSALVPFKYYYSAIVVDRTGSMGPKGKKHALSTTALIPCDLVTTAAA